MQFTSLSSQKTQTSLPFHAAIDLCVFPRVRDLEPYHEVNVDTEVNFFQGRRHSAPLEGGRTAEQARYRKFCGYEAYRLDAVCAPISIKNT